MTQYYAACTVHTDVDPALMFLIAEEVITSVNAMTRTRVCIISSNKLVL